MSDADTDLIFREVKKLVHLRACWNWLSHSLGRVLHDVPMEMWHDALLSVGLISFTSTTDEFDPYENAMLNFIHLKAHVTYLSIREIVAHANNHVQPITARVPFLIMHIGPAGMGRTCRSDPRSMRGTGNDICLVLIDVQYYAHDDDEKRIDRLLCLNHSREEKDRVCREYKNGMFSFTMTPEHTIPVYSNYIMGRSFFRKPKPGFSRCILLDMDLS